MALPSPWRTAARSCVTSSGIGPCALCDTVSPLSCKSWISAGYLTPDAISTRRAEAGCPLSPPPRVHPGEGEDRTLKGGEMRRRGKPCQLSNGHAFELRAATEAPAIGESRRQQRLPRPTATEPVLDSTPHTGNERERTAPNETSK